MAASLVDSDVFTFADGDTGHVCDLGSSPNIGEWDILYVSSDTTVDTPATWTASETAVSQMGAYIFTRKSTTGSEPSTVSVNTTGNLNTVVSWHRWSGLNAIDTTTNSQANASSGSSSPAHTTGTLATNTNVIMAMNAVSDWSAGQPSAISWTGSYTQVTAGHISTTSVEVSNWTAYKLNVGTAAEAPSSSWTGACLNRYMLAITFTVLADAAPKYTIHRKNQNLPGPQHFRPTPRLFSPVPVVDIVFTNAQAETAEVSALAFDTTSDVKTATDAAVVVVAANNTTVSTTRDAFAGVASVAVAAGDATTSIKPTPSTAVVTTNTNSNVGVGVSSGASDVGVVANAPTTKISPTPTTAPIGAVAEQPTVNIGGSTNAAAGVASVVVAANGSTTKVSPSSEVATAAVASNSTNSSVATTSQTATVTTTTAANSSVAPPALFAHVLVHTRGRDVQAGVAEVGVVANDSTVSTGGNATNANAGVAVVGVTATTPAAVVAPSSGVASVTATSNNLTAKVSPTPTTAPVGAVAHQPFVDTGGNTNAQAGVAGVAVTTGGTSQRVTAMAGVASVGVVANAPPTTVKPTGGLASVNAVAHGTTSLIKPTPVTANVASAVNTTNETVKTNGGVAPAGVVAHDATVSTATLKQVFPGTATVGVAANGNTAKISTGSGVASVGVATNSSPSVKTNAGNAVVMTTATSSSIRRDVVAFAGLASVGVTTNTPMSSVKAKPEFALVGAAALAVSTKPVATIPPATVVIREPRDGLIVRDPSNNATINQTPNDTVIRKTNSSSFIIRKPP